MGRRGFTLLEVMIAMAILAFLMAAISSTQGSSLLQGARVYNLTTATQLLDSIVLDLEEEYRLEGFPENSLEDRKCDVPREFRAFTCHYDLLALDVGADNISALGQQATETVGGSPLIQTLCGGGANGGGTPDNPSAALAGMGGSGELGALAALLDPQFATLCGLNLAKMCQNMPLMASFLPTIIEQAARSTRKLRVRISWDERGNAEKVLEIETFIVAVPAAEEENTAP
jgi:prepilin-type N-terminal cleavage/methylation domain-containing protein